MATFRGKTKVSVTFLKEVKNGSASLALRSSPASLRWNVSCPSAEAAHLRSREEMCGDGRRAGANASAEENTSPQKNEQKTPQKLKETHAEKHTSGGRSLENECIVLHYVCMYYWVCSLHSTADSESVSLQKTHFIRYILKYYKKHLRFFLSFMCFFFCVFFSWIWWPVLLFRLPLQLTCQWITTTSTDHTVKLYNFRKHDRIYSICYTFTMLFNSV